MQDQKKTKNQLISELVELRQKVVETDEATVDNGQSEQKLADVDGLYRSVIDSISEPLHVVGLDLRVNIFNTAFAMWCKELGFEADMTGKTIFEVFPFLPEEVRDEYRQVFDTGNTFVTTGSSVVGDREIITETTKSPVISANRVEQVITVVRDITKSKRAEDSLRKSEARWHNLLQSIPAFIAEIDLDGVLVALNRTQPGFSVEDFISKPVLDVVPPGAHASMKTAFTEVIEKGVSAQYEHETPDYGPEKKPAWYHDQLAPVFMDGEIKSVILVVSDITERKQAEEALRESEERFRAFMDNGPFTAQIKDKTFKYIYGDADTLRAHGMTLDEYTRITSHDVFPKYVADEIEVADRKVLEENVTVEVEQFLIMENGEKRWWNNIKFPIHGPGGETVVGGIAMEVTERKKAEEAIKKSGKKYRELFDNMNSGFALHEIITDKKGKPVDYIFLEINDAFEKLTGLKRENIIGKKVTKALPGIENDPANWIGRYGEVALKGISARFEQHAESLNKWFSINAYSPEDGKFAAIFEDITERKQTEEALRQSADIVNNIQVGLHIYHLEDINDDRTLRMVAANKATEDMTGVLIDSVIGKTLDENFPGLREKGVPQQYAEVVRTESLWR